VISVTVAVCVIGEFRDFESFLESFTQAEVCLYQSEKDIQLDLELLIVHNGPLLIHENFVADLEKKSCLKTPLRIIRSQEFNLSVARNTALHSSDKEWIFFVDDDAILDPNIFSELEFSCKTAESLNCVVVGGRILLVGGDGCSEFHQAWLSKLDLGSPSRIITDQYINGANFVVKREIALHAGGFDPKLGRQGSLLVSGEETEILNRLRKYSQNVFYNHNQVVIQVVPESRTERRYLGKRIAWEAVTRALIHNKEGSTLGDRKGWVTPSDQELNYYLQTFTQLLTFGEIQDPLRKKLRFIFFHRLIKKLVNSFFKKYSENFVNES
jgi:glycosyltransferase involved in cell wall biosynthesis